MQIITDFLIIGTGCAGLTFALQVAEYGKVAIITKRDCAESNTNYAQGGIATVLDPSDSYELHIEDTLNAGDYLGNPEVIRIMVEEGPNIIHQLLEWGAQFTHKDKADNTEGLALGREGGHSKRRIIFAADMTGKELERTLIEQAKKHPNITIYENHIAVDIITEHQIRSIGLQKSEQITCWGVYGLDILANEVNVFIAKQTLLATGGAGQIYLHTTNPSIATGDGLVMAYRAGADIANLEFVQFHPTSLYESSVDFGGRSFLISEAVRGEGGILKSIDGEEFMEKYDKRASLAPRDIVARAIDAEMKKRGDNYVLLDITHLSAKRIRERFPLIYSTCLKRGIDITIDCIPVVPAAHYTCGGVMTDIYGQTNIKQLYAAGEVAHTGVHGANRLASNSLLEAMVFATRAAKKSIEIIKNISSSFNYPEILSWNDEGLVRAEEEILISHDREAIRTLMWDYVGIVRSNRRLKRAKRRLGFLLEDINKYFRTTKLSPSLIELRNLTVIARLIVRCSLKRKESRGLHYNINYPKKDDKWKKDTIIRKSWRKNGH